MRQVSEYELVAAWTAGELFDAGREEAGHERQRRFVDARLIRRFCLQRRAEVDPHGVRLRGAHVTGTVDLAGIDVPFPVAFDDCTFAEAPVLDGATLHALAITRSPELPGLIANGLQVRRDVDLSDSRIVGSHATTASTSKKAAVWLCEAVIGGRLMCLNTFIDAGEERALQADRLQVGGNVRLIRGFATIGELRLIGARIAGSLDLTGARLSAPAVALSLDEVVVATSVFLIEDTTGRRPVIDGRLDLNSARIGSRFVIRNVTCTAAINAPRIHVGEALVIDGESTFAGGIDLSAAELSQVSIASQSRLNAPGLVALNLTTARLGSSLHLAEGLRIRGTVQLRGTRIEGNLDMDGVTLSEPKGKSLLAAHKLAVTGDVLLKRITATGGQLRFWRATIGGGLDAAGSRLDNPGWHTLSLHHAVVGGSVRLVDGFHSTGFVMLGRALIDGRLDFSDGVFDCPGPTRDNPGGYAIRATAATVRGGIDLGWRSAEPSVDLASATTSVLADDPQRWPERFVVSGLTYQRLSRPRQYPDGHVWDWRQRVAWLRRHEQYDSGPYGQLANVFRDHGYGAEAEQILIAQRRHRRELGPRLPVLRRLLDRFYDVVVGYGYRPGRVLWALLGLLILVGLSVAVDPGRAALRATDPAGNVYTVRGLLPNAANTDSCGDGRVRCFNPVFYAIDTVIPLVSLDQRTTWHPDRHSRDGTLIEWWLNLATVAGWLLSSIIVLSLTRLARSA